MNIPVVASNNVRHAVAEDYVLSDLLTCIGLGHSVDEPHLDRPKNAEAYLKNEKALKNFRDEIERDMKLIKKPDSL